MSVSGRSFFAAFAVLGSVLASTAIAASAPFPITRRPTPDDWSYGPAVETLRNGVPRAVSAWLQGLKPAALRRVASRTYVQALPVAPGTPPREVAVELTVGLVDEPLDRFLAALPACRWGVSLSGYLGGEVQVLESDAAGRPLRQVERMVLSFLPCDANLDLTNLDMTKVERIAYGDAQVEVTWRVYHSDNGSTETDIGRVEFRRFDADSTLVTFHSAHRISVAGGRPVPASLTRLFLGTMFRDHVLRYRDLVQQAPPAPVR